jgi:hypothetical protein
MSMEEAQEFLRDFRMKLFAAHVAIRAAAFERSCTLSEDSNPHAPASICRECYDGLERRAAMLEAVLFIDIEEATRIIYDAVWADPSDPGKTYRNAATALLKELRARAHLA